VGRDGEHHCYEFSKRNEDHDVPMKIISGAFWLFVMPRFGEAYFTVERMLPASA
jgi:hypothetical protein